MFTFPDSISLYPIFDYSVFNMFKIVYFSDKHELHSITAHPTPQKKRLIIFFASRTWRFRYFGKACLR